MIAWTAIIAVVLLSLGVIFLLRTSPWRYCGTCERYWHTDKLDKYTMMPGECDGVCKAETCPECYNDDGI